MDKELARRVAAALSEVTVKAHTSRSKKGKTFNVKQHERDIKSMVGKRLSFKNTIASGMSDQYGARMSGIFQGIDKATGMAKLKTAKRGILMPVEDIPALRKFMSGNKTSIKKFTHDVTSQMDMYPRRAIGMDISKFGKARHYSDMTADEIASEKRKREEWYRKTFGKK